jgi:hypothetical protein
MRLALTILLLASGSCFAATPEDMVRAYPAALSGFDGTNLIWRDGTRMPIGQVQPDGDATLSHASIADQLARPVRRCCRRRTIPAVPATRRSSTRCMATAGPGRSRRSWYGSYGCRGRGDTLSPSRR